MDEKFLDALVAQIQLRAQRLHNALDDYYRTMGKTPKGTDGGVVGASRRLLEVVDEFVAIVPCFNHEWTTKPTTGGEPEIYCCKCGREQS